jgi:beta-lactamase class A
MLFSAPFLMPRQITRQMTQRFFQMHLKSFLRKSAAALLCSVVSALAVAQNLPFTLFKPATNDGAWVQRLAADVAAIDAASESDVGVYVLELDSGLAMNYQADKNWYIASMIKVPVAIAILRGIEAGTYTLDTTLRLRASDYVDGAGATNSHPLATALPIRYLMEQMIIHSDNTASDMLIDLVGTAQINVVVAGLVPQGFGRITSLADVRRQIYGQLTPESRHLAGTEFIALHRQHTDGERLELLSHILHVPVTSFRRKSLDAAYAAYYATGVNSARLDAYGQLLVLLAEGKALGLEQTQYLLGLMEKVVSGEGRIKAGLAPGTRFAHKTGTQRHLVCDAGLLQARRIGPDKRAIVVACARGEQSRALLEGALRDVGNAICRSGLLDKGVTDAPSCDVAPHVGRLLVPSTAGSADPPDSPLR